MCLVKSFGWCDVYVHEALVLNSGHTVLSHNIIEYYKYKSKTSKELA